MNEFNLSYEQFLAVTRQHFFSGDPLSPFGQDEDEDRCSCGDTQHRAYPGK